MRWVMVTAFILAATGQSAAQDRRIAVRMLHIDQPFQDLAYQWVEARNVGSAPLRGVVVNCVFFEGTRPITDGVGLSFGEIPPGESRTLRVGMAFARGTVTRTECTVRETAWDGR